MKKWKCLSIPFSAAHLVLVGPLWYPCDVVNTNVKNAIACSIRANSCVLCAVELITIDLTLAETVQFTNPIGAAALNGAQSVAAEAKAILSSAIH